MIQTKEDKEVMFARNILCEIIHQAMADAAIDESKIVCERNREIAASWREDAVRFIKTKSFEGICNTLGLEVDPFRKKAYL
jgi:hypothetical protein